MRKGKLITFEGIDGSGKSTQAALLSHWMSDQGITHYHTYEPGGTLFGMHVRNDLLHGELDICPLAESFLFLADRAQHFEKKVLPRLEMGHVVLIDRCIDSTIAYQGFGKQVEIGSLVNMNMIATKGIMPDLTILLDITPREAQKRKGIPSDRLEEYGLLIKARSAYLAMARNNPYRFSKIDATLPRETIHGIIVGQVKKLLEE